VVLDDRVLDRRRRHQARLTVDEFQRSGWRACQAPNSSTVRGLGQRSRFSDPADRVSGGWA
jgi:hypothetical protein